LSRETTNSERGVPAPSWENASKGAIAHAHENLSIFCLLVRISSFVEAARTIPRYNIAIVDRQGDVFVVTNTFYKLEVCRDDLFGETNTDYRLTLPYAPPLFGFGKTALAINYLTLLDSVGVDWVASQKSLPGLSPEQFLERMKKACFLYVDLSFLRGMPPDERNLEWAVWYLIIEAACTKVALPVPDPVEVYE